MDRFIAGFPSTADGDLMLCPEHGVAYQTDMTVRAVYDESYFNKCASYEDRDIALKINAGRIALVDRHTGPWWDVLDVGVGSGEFIKKRPRTFGYDINPRAVEWLKANNRWRDDLANFTAFTFWDVLEHVEDPEQNYFCHMRAGSFLFTSLPVFEDLTRIRDSKHYRPGEHLTYWSPQGLIGWMAMHGFNCLETADFETAAGRDSIMSFAFRRTSMGSQQ